MPSGASTGQYEAVELRDKEERYGGLGVERAVDHVNAKIAPAVIGERIEQLVSTPSCCSWMVPRISLISVPMLCWECLYAAARAAAGALHMPLYAYLGGTNVKKMPVPMMNIMNGVLCG